MDGSDGLSIEAVGALAEIDKAQWDACANPPGAAYDPFLSWDFLQALEETGCVAPRTGWTPAHLIAREGGRLIGVAPLYAKTHSRGEYVFDHAWADAFYRAGGAYYPKLQACVPFTPVPGRRLLTQSPRAAEALALGAEQLMTESGSSSVHVTFALKDECDRLERLGYLTRVGLQYHWYNEGYGSFDDFLATLSSNKRKNIRKERARAVDGVTIKRLRGDDIKAQHWDTFFRCYIDTGSRKWGSPYLNRDAFALLGERMADQIVLYIAEEDGRPIASALNFLGGEALYGRYWGRVADREFLHFELCYYQAIDTAIELGLPRVEAGAQGEHKLARGYRPSFTYSAHLIAHQGLRDAVKRYLEMETPAMTDERDILDAHTPFKKSD